MPIDHIKLTHSLEDIELNTVCPKCGEAMEYKEGRYGAFLGCTEYPNCKHTEKIMIIGNYR